MSDEKYVGAVAAAKQAALIKAYVDSKVKKDFVVNITFDSTAAPAAIDDANLAVFNASTDKTFAEISSAVAAGKNVYGMWNGHKWPLYLSSSTSFAFRGHIQLANLFGTVGLSIAICSIWQDGCDVTVSAGELPVPALDGSDDGKCIAVSGHQWAMKKAAVATTSANGLMSAADKVKLDGVEAGANKTTVDAALDAASENPVQNKAVKAALDGKLDKTGGTLTGNLRVTGALFSGDGLSFGTGENIHFTKAADDAGKLAHGTAGVDDTVPLARLKVASPTEDDDAATKAYVDGRAAGSGAVRYDAAQTLEVAQQFQARKNIGAIGYNSPQFQGFLALAPANAPLGTGVGLSPSGSGNDFTLDISDVNENTPTLLTGVKTPTDADTNAAATVEYVMSKVASGGGSADAVLYTEQTLTTEQKKQARDNIDAAVADFVVNGTVNSDKTVTIDKTFAQIQEAVQGVKKDHVRLLLTMGNSTFVMPIVVIASNAIAFQAEMIGRGNVVQTVNVSVTANGSTLTLNEGISLDSNRNLPQIKMAADPTEAMQIATKKYVDDALAAIVDGTEVSY